MAYPLSADFTSGAPASAWWGYTLSSGAQQICSTTGSALIAKLRAILGLDSTNLVWDSALQQALISSAGSMPSSIQQALQADLTAGSVSNISLGYGIYLAYYQQSNLAPSAIGVPNGAIVPQFGVPVQPSQDPTWNDLICFNPASDPAPLSLSPAARQTAQQQSASGVRLAAGQTPASIAITLPALGEVVGLPILLLLGVVFVGGIWWLSEQNKSATQRVRTRSRRRS